MQRTTVTPDVASATSNTKTQQSRITLDELAKARPKRANSAPARCASHKSAILALLCERGPAGVLGSELYNSPEKFGRSPRNRVSELRREGHLISGAPRGGSDWHYVLIRDSNGTQYAEPKPAPVSTYMKRIKNEQDAAAPLFAEVSGD
jgi:hypothetical protein